MKLWDKGHPINKRIEQFTIGNDREMDLRLAIHDVEGSMAHAQMLASIGMLSADENDQLQQALAQIKTLITDGRFAIAEGIEDVHSQVEFLLTESLGEVGKKIHLGRSRNDQVLVDLRLYFRSELQQLKQLCLETAAVLIDYADRYKDHLMPGYTHTQVGMVSSFGLWLSAYAEALIDDADYFDRIYHQINRNPLGTAAGYGSSIPIDRQMTTAALGFEGLCVNPINAQLQRGKTELLVAHGLSAVALTLNKMSTDLCFYCNENYRFIKLPTAYTTGSSIMPHKKNPDVFELMRAHSNVLMSLSGQVSHAISNLISGYHRDFQLLKENVIPSIEKAKELISLLQEAIPHIEILPIDMKNDQYKYLYSVELVNQYVLDGMPFRDAYKKVGEMIENGTYDPPQTLNHTHIGSIGNLGLDILQTRIEKLR